MVGKIEHLHVEEGDEVEAGQLILELEKDALRPRREIAPVRNFGSLALVRRQARIDVEDAEVKRRRMERLFGEQIASKSDLESAELFLSVERARAGAGAGSGDAGPGRSRTGERGPREVAASIRR